MIDKNELLNKITEQQILDLIKSFGAVPHQIKQNEIWFKTICHGGDSHKLCYFRDTKDFYCYTNCGKMSLYNFVMNVKNIGFGEALKIVAKAAGYNSRYGIQTATKPMTSELEEMSRLIQRKNKKCKQIQHLPRIDDMILNYFEKDVFYSGWIDEGISPETMQYFNIRWYELEKHIIIPHYNINGELVGIRRRSLQAKDKNNKYMPETIENITYAHPLGLNLYGLERHLKGIRKLRRVILVESEKSVMLDHDYYGEDACTVATCGFNVSNWQRDVILSLGVDAIILGYDKDFDPVQFMNVSDDDPECKKYLRYVSRIQAIADKFTPYCQVYALWDTFGLLDIKDSPFDKGKEVLETLMKNKVELTTET